jgi:hypothetical protein
MPLKQKAQDKIIITAREETYAPLDSASLQSVQPLNKEKIFSAHEHI